MLAITLKCFSFDDFKVYSISGLAAPTAEVSLSGKANIGAQLSAIYSYSEPLLGEEEGESIGYWEVADDSSFINATKLGDDIQMQAEDVAKYTITENERGKYIRFCVIPKSISGTEGTVAFSNSTPLIDTYYIQSVSTTGSINGTMFEYKGYSGFDTYKGRVKVFNSTLEEKSITLITAWYDENNNLIEVYTDNIISPQETNLKMAHRRNLYKYEGKFIPNKDTLWLNNEGYEPR